MRGSGERSEGWGVGLWPWGGVRAHGVRCGVGVPRSWGRMWEGSVVEREGVASGSVSLRVAAGGGASEFFF